MASWFEIRGTSPRSSLATSGEGGLPRTHLLGTRAKLFRRCRTHRNTGTSVRQSTLEDSPTPSAVPSANTSSTPRQGTSLSEILLLTYCYKASDIDIGAHPFYGFCRQKREPTSGLEPLTCHYE
jgi:hypothetical protein